MEEVVGSAVEARMDQLTNHVATQALAARLRALREQAGLGVTEAARRLNASQPSVSSAIARSNADLASAVTTPFAAATSASPRSECRPAVSPPSGAVFIWRAAMSFLPSLLKLLFGRKSEPVSTPAPR